jgi:hypothetical protein
LFDLKSREIFLSRDVTFFEHIFPYSSQTSDVNTPTSSKSTYNQFTYDDTDFCQYLISPPNPSLPHTSPNPLTSNTTLNLPNNSLDINSPLPSHISNTPTPDPPPLPQPLRQSLTQTKPPQYLQDYHCNLITENFHDSSTAASQSSSQCKYPLSNFVSYQNVSAAHKHFALNLSTLTEPTSYEVAMSDEH